MKQSKEITDGALLLSIYMIILLAAIFVPVMILPSLFLLPIPLIMYSSTYRWQQTLILGAGAILLSLFIVPFISIPLTVLACSGGILTGLAIQQKLSPYETLARVTAGYVAGLVFTYIYIQYFFQINWDTVFTEAFTDSLQMSRSLFQQFGLPEQQLNELFLIFEESLSAMLNLLPVAFVMVALVIAWISQWLSYKVLNRTKQKKLFFPPFRKFKLPTATVWIYFFALIVTLFETDVESIFFIGANNIISLLGFLMIIQGFSFIFFFAYQQRMSKAFPIISIVVTMMFPFLLSPIVRIIGIIDIGFGLREHMTRKK